MLCEQIHASHICPPHVSTSTAGNSEIAVSSSNEGGTAQAGMPVHATGRAEECISLNGLKIDYLLTEKYPFPLVSYLSKAVKPHIRGRRLFKSTCAEICILKAGIANPAVRTRPKAIRATSEALLREAALHPSRQKQAAAVTENPKGQTQVASDFGAVR